MGDRWIKLYEKMLDWEWISCPEMVCVWVNLLLRAAPKAKRMKGSVIRKGQVVTTLGELAKWSGISIQQLRTCINRLISTREITYTATRKNITITISKFDNYQHTQHVIQHTAQHEEQHTSNTQATHKQHTEENIPFSSFLHEKSKHNVRVCNNAHAREASPTAQIEKKTPSERFLRFQEWVATNAPSVAALRDPFTEEQFDKLHSQYTSEQIADILLQMHNRPDLGKKYRSAYLTALNWLKRDNNGKHASSNQKNSPAVSHRDYGEGTI